MERGGDAVKEEVFQALSSTLVKLNASEAVWQDES